MDKFKVEKATEEDVKLFMEGEKEARERYKKSKWMLCPTCMHPILVEKKQPTQKHPDEKKEANRK